MRSFPLFWDDDCWSSVGGWEIKVVKFFELGARNTTQQLGIKRGTKLFVALWIWNFCENESLTNKIKHRRLPLPIKLLLSWSLNLDYLLHIFTCLLVYLPQITFQPSLVIWIVVSLGWNLFAGFPTIHNSFLPSWQKLRHNLFLHSNFLTKLSFNSLAGKSWTKLRIETRALQAWIFAFPSYFAKKLVNNKAQLRFH